MDLRQALDYSRYASRAFTANPGLAEEVVDSLDAPFDWPDPATFAADDEAALAARLRKLRTRLFIHGMLRDLTGRAPLTEVCRAMTRLADVAIRETLRVHAAALDAMHGAPIGEESGRPQSLIVIGMGKLGGHELNVSSDIDLVFVYPEEGETAGPRTISNREYFDRLGRRLVAGLNDATPDGYVFRVDMRLRPYSESRALTTSFAGLEHYLLSQGRAWERYAWLKARPITGDRHGELMDLVTPFVFRKYLDYDAYEGLRDVHRQIREQGARRDALANVKIGEGGIREIEFIAQALQIVRGGREPELRVRGTLPALAILEERELMPASSVDSLRDAYVFLRNVEHRLQYRDDAQTHDLPEDAAEHAALAAAMDLDVAGFDRELARHRGVVAFTFAQTFGDTGHGGDDARERFAAVWDTPEASDDNVARLAEAGYDDPAAVIAILARVRGSGRYRELPATSQHRFDVLVPRILAAAAASPGLTGSLAVFERLVALLESVARRSAYLALVIEHPPLLPRLANLMGASAWAADYLTRHPILLDELLDARALMAEPDWAQWRSELARLLAERPDDAEHQMDVLRHFRHAQTFRLLAQDLADRLTVERLADHLSALADVVLDGALAACWRILAGASATPATPPRFAIVGYGKLGGKELGYASDLDLVFLFDVPEDDPDPDAKEYAYTRLAQRLNTWLTSTTAAGPLYDTDLRLRPDGAKGLLASSLRGFVRYQREHAWLWEHQALTRARYVAGDASVGQAFEEARFAILTMARDPATLRDEVVAMRRKMHAGHPNPTGLFDLKHDPGGMVDIEFTVQCLVLGHAHRHESLTRNLGNIALLRMAGELGLVPGALAREVADAYRDYRSLQHKVRLTGAPHARVDPAPHAARRAAVTALWTHVFGEPWHATTSR
ncbi:MAG: bifunctional [glutamate--ammonia ligase]-adenylyl-L-tyrosine phosphorylase/[glutamate--ammonia-ligase] adenylyltransferase [Burkholderiales bacterium]